MIHDELRERVPGATTSVSGLEWLRSEDNDDDDDDVTIGRLLLVDRSALLVSSTPTDGHGERAVS